ncbi:hypothetical protein [Tenacibaculum sp. SG-28]|uniref:hypothetical protein n=1 Tax=Tenacibaculum sp. SG-28 TaxID=754426 RepID=UPI001E653902|nr:hypothetical protein [Tenacibaculum sp. SG-28]
MNSKIEVIHTHFHNRRTGVTRSIENIIPFLQKYCNVHLYGYSIAGKILGKKNFKKIIFSKNTSIVHCHRNNEIVKMLFFRLLGAKFKLVTTRHAATKPSALTLFLLRKSDAVVTLTNAMSEQLQMPNKKIPHGVNTDVFQKKTLLFLL